MGLRQVDDCVSVVGDLDAPKSSPSALGFEGEHFLVPWRSLMAWLMDAALRLNKMQPSFLRMMTSPQYKWHRKIFQAVEALGGVPDPWPLLLAVEVAE